MKRFVVLMALLGGVLVVTPTPAQAGVTPTASMTIVNAVAYDAPQDFPLTVCINGAIEEVDLPTTEQIGPLDLEPGGYTIEFFQGDDCTGEPFVESGVDVTAGIDFTVMAYWGLNGPFAAFFNDDMGCVEDGLTRVTFRHGASAGWVDWFITPGGGTPEYVFGIVGNGTDAVTDLVAQDYEASELRETGTDVVALDTGEPGDLTTTTAYYLYYFGGADGDTGYFTHSVEVEQCTPETTTTAAPTTTTTAAAAAVVTPRFAG